MEEILHPLIWSNIPSFTRFIENIPGGDRRISEPSTVVSDFFPFFSQDLSAKLAEENPSIDGLCQEPAIWSWK